MSHGWAAGSTRAWRRLRRLVLERDGYRCQLQVRGVCRGGATQVHHTLGKGRGDDIRTLVAACGPCNQHVGDPSRHDPPSQSVSTW